jgi:4-hydroxybutyryl-CoA dehydratase/vinylacetyl-CoA-Delta-isomerase
MDKKLGTKYYDRFNEYLRYVQREDLVCDGAMTDPKGDRSLRPHQQDDPDLYLHVVERRDDGIIVRGAKAHQTGCINSQEIIAEPTITMREKDKDYALAFALPSDTEGITYIYGRQPCDTRKLEGGDLMDIGNPSFGGQEALVVFDDVFVPWERVFMCGEYQFSGDLVTEFASYHRQSYGGCKAGVGDALIGAAATIADYNGTSKAYHIRNKIAEMIHLNESIYACGIACSSQGTEMPSGTYYVDPLLANVCKHNVTRFPYEICRLAEDIAGGALVTLPSEKDLESTEVGKYVKKYFKGAKGVPTEDRMRMFRFIENLTVGIGCISYRTESMHGAGSPEAQRIMYRRLVNLESKKELAKSLAKIGKKKGFVEVTEESTYSGKSEERKA